VGPTQPTPPKTEKSRPNPTHGSTQPIDNSVSAGQLYEYLEVGREDVGEVDDAVEVEQQSLKWRRQISRYMAQSISTQPQLLKPA